MNRNVQRNIYQASTYSLEGYKALTICMKALVNSIKRFKAPLFKCILLQYLELKSKMEKSENTSLANEQSIEANRGVLQRLTSDHEGRTVNV